MLRDYLGLRESEEKRERRAERREHDCRQALPLLRAQREPRGSQAEIPFPGSSQADLAAAGTGGLCPPAPSRRPHSTPAPPGCPKPPRPGMEAAGPGRAALRVP